MTPAVSDEDILKAVAAYRACPYNFSKAARDAGLDRMTLKRHLKTASERGEFLDHKPAMPGFRVSQVTVGPNGKSIQQKREHGEAFAVPEGHIVKGVSALVDEEGREVVKWIKTSAAATLVADTIRTVVDELKKDLPRLTLPVGPSYLNEDLLNQFTITDLHMGMMAWKEETGVADYDLKVAEKLLIDWFSAAIAMSPNAKTAVFAQIGDFMHHDSHESVTPAHRHVLDADSRLQKIIRVCIRVNKQIIAMLAHKHEHVHVIYADANHDPASSAWMRELLNTMYEDEPRVTIDNSPGTYYAHEHGRTGLFYHHGHKKPLNDLAEMFAAKFREIFGRCLQCYGHTGHKHNDEISETPLMKVERHRTLAPPDSYGSNWVSGRDAKVITYHREFGEVGRSIISPRMLAANDNVLNPNRWQAAA